VELTLSGRPNDIMATAASYDSTLRYGTQTPFNDQLTFHWEGGEWQVDSTHNSIITAGNGGSIAVKTQFTIYYDGGTKRYDLEQQLRPHEQMWVDVGKLIREQVPDKNGLVLPSDLTMGSYALQDLTDRGVGNLFEGKVILDKTFGHVSYGCSTCCGYLSPWMYWDPIGVGVGLEGDQDVWSTNMCDDTSGSVLFAIVGSSWNTGNHAIATASNAKITGVALGSTTNYAEGDLTLGGAMSKHCTYTQVTPSGLANVQVPTDSRIVSTISSFAMNSSSSPACPAGQAGWYRRVQKIVTDQTGTDITVDGSTISETLGLTSTNQLNLGKPTAFPPVSTSGGGYFDDQFGFCSPLCPGSAGMSDLTEVFTDTVASGVPYTLKAHTLQYTCSGDTDNGQ
jgi:hypothetical protein